MGEAHPSLPSPSTSLGTPGVPDSFLALPLTPGVTLGQPLNSCSGAQFTPPSRGEKRPCSSLSGTVSGFKQQEKEARVKGVGTTSENPHSVLHRVSQSSLPQSPSRLRDCDFSILAQKRRPQHLLNPLWGAELAGEARGGGDRQEAGARGNPQAPG